MASHRIAEHSTTTAAKSMPTTTASALMHAHMARQAYLTLASTLSATYGAEHTYTQCAPLGHTQQKTQVQSCADLQHSLSPDTPGMCLSCIFTASLSCSSYCPYLPMQQPPYPTRFTCMLSSVCCSASCRISAVWSGVGPHFSTYCSACRGKRGAATNSSTASST